MEQNKTIRSCNVEHLVSITHPIDIYSTFKVTVSIPSNLPHDPGIRPLSTTEAMGIYITIYVIFVY